ncbi:hypothetical protein ANN_14237 [Periplaneta americana]|uniref:Uncharacterized protein n=1 Tax=Periplaneta americana TaxID=6978 RepID=A0ABQ8SVR7_PERAM|nr:hypothetical protein ANN_14237 [Periplaneta americana]
MAKREYGKWERSNLLKAMDEFYPGAVGLNECCLKVAEYTAKSNKDILYPNIPPAIRAVAHGPDIPFPLPPESDTLPSPSSSTENESPVDHTYEPYNTGEDRCFNQSELNDLVRDLNFPKESAELLGSRLKEKKVLAEEGLLLVDIMPHGSTINSDGYVATLKKLQVRLSRVRRHREKQDALLLHDNAQPYVSHKTTDQIRKFG